MIARLPAVDSTSCHARFVAWYSAIFIVMTYFTLWLIDQFWRMLPHVGIRTYYRLFAPSNSVFVTYIISSPFAFTVCAEFNFCRAMLCISRPMPSCGVCPSVRPCCCLPRSYIVSKRVFISSKKNFTFGDSHTILRDTKILHLFIFAITLSNCIMFWWILTHTYGSKFATKPQHNCPPLLTGVSALPC